MPIDYSKCSPEWKTKVRPDILERDKNCCKLCNVPNYSVILRGIWEGFDAYQDMDGNIFNGFTSEKIGEGYLGDIEGDSMAIKIVLTVAHLDHNIANNDYSNLAALCQRCHNRYDVRQRVRNRNKNSLIEFPE